jgi:hypothetical protein
MSTVKVAADKNGNVIGISQNNPEYGYIRVEQAATQINDQGWLRNVKRSALIKGKVEDLLACNYKEGTTINGKIVVVESLTPFNPTNPDRDLKVAGETGVICRIDDQPIYRQTFFTQNLNAYDELITHDNTDEIKDVQVAQRSISSLSAFSKNEGANL